MFDLEAVMILPFRLLHNKQNFPLPISLYSCGLHGQHTQYRPIGYPTLQVFICFGGAGTFQFQHRPYIRLKENEVFIVPSKLAHDYSPSGEEPWLLGYIGIEGTYAEAFIHSAKIPILKPMALQQEKMNLFSDKLALIWHSPETNQEDESRVASLYAYDLLTLIASQVVEQTSPASDKSHSTATNAILNAVKYIEQHYNEQLTISNIAYAVGYSKQHFQRKFKEMYGINPHLYLQRLRLAKAAALLEQHSNVAIQEVAAMIGVETNYFVRLFKQEYDITPAKYRAKFGKQ